MKAAELASLIISVCPDWVDVDEQIAFSAMPDNRIITEYYCCPQTGVSILAKYTDAEIEKVFAGCNTLTECTERVEGIYGQQSLSDKESRYAITAATRAAMEAAIDIQQSRQLVHNQQTLRPILVLVAQHLSDHFTKVGQLPNG